MRTLENISQEQFERLERYTLNLMSASEKESFDAELESNEVLRAQVEEFQAMIAGIETATLKEKFNEYHEELVPERSPEQLPGSKRTLKWAVAAILVVALGSLWMLSSDSKHDKLFATHFKPDPGLPTTMGTTSNFEFYDGMVSYKQGAYKSALKKWGALETGAVGGDTLNYFRGVAHLADGDARKSIEYLQSLWDSGESSFRNETAHYLGMAYLKSGDLENAVKYLTFSKDERAEKVLSDLTD